jgi:hypothetical protein
VLNSDDGARKLFVMAGAQRPESRRLGIVVKTSPGALPVLVAAGFVSASACGESTEIRTRSFVDHDASNVGGGGPGGTGGGITFGSGGAATGGFAFGTGGEIIIPSGTGGSCNYTVPLPPEGTPAEPGQICAVALDPVDSNLSARVTFNIDATGVRGTVLFDPKVAPRITGVPKIEVLDASDAALMALQIGQLTKAAGGFSFPVTFPQPVSLKEGYSRVTVRVTFDVECGPDGGNAKQVHAATDLHLCSDSIGGSAWVSSGDRCVVCRIIAEMAPSPIVPDKSADGLPLARALRLRVVELARVANRVVLFAENDGGDGLDYEWHPSAGRVERLAPDVVVWTVAEGMAAPLMQVAVMGATEAAVASWSWNEAA